VGKRSSRLGPDSDEDDNTCLEGLIPEDPFVEIDKNGITYLPQPSTYSNGVLACNTIRLIAENVDRGESYFVAQEVTLVMETDDRKPMYFTGQATLRLDEPYGCWSPSAPRRDLTNDARHKIFQKRIPYGPDVRDSPTDLPTTTPRGNQIRWYTMTKEELDAVLDDLSEDPMESGEAERTYTIEKVKNGMVRVRPGLQLSGEGTEPSTQDRDPRTPRGKKKDVSKTDEGTDLNEQRILTRLGNDPHPADRKPEAGEHMDRELELGTTGGDAKDSKYGGNYEDNPRRLRDITKQNVRTNAKYKNSPTHNRRIAIPHPFPTSNTTHTSHNGPYIEW
jgi:hypothetical protein